MRFLITMFAFSFANAGITNCDQDSVFQITQLGLEPSDTVVAGQNVSLILFYTSPTTVDSGTITTSVTYNFLPLTPTVAPLCDSAPCPIEVGDHDGSSWFVIPSGISGNVVTKIVWADANATQLLCLNMNVKASLF